MVIIRSFNQLRMQNDVARTKRREKNCSDFNFRKVSRVYAVAIRTWTLTRTARYHENYLQSAVKRDHILY